MKVGYETNEATACKVLQIVDQGLTRGLGKPEPGELCLEAAVCLAYGLDHQMVKTFLTQMLETDLKVIPISVPLPLETQLDIVNTANIDAVKRLTRFAAPEYQAKLLSLVSREAIFHRFKQFLDHAFDEYWPYGTSDIPRLRRAVGSCIQDWFARVAGKPPHVMAASAAINAFIRSQLMETGIMWRLFPPRPADKSVLGESQDSPIAIMLHPHLFQD